MHLRKKLSISCSNFLVSFLALPNSRRRLSCLIEGGASRPVWCSNQIMEKGLLYKELDYSRGSNMMKQWHFKGLYSQAEVVWVRKPFFPAQFETE